MRRSKRKSKRLVRLLGFERMKPLKEALPPEITYEEIRLVAAHLRLEKENESQALPSGAGEN